MEKDFNSTRIATLTSTAVKDDETFQSEGGFVPARDQYYFEMQQGDHTFLLGFKDLLTCLRLMEKMGETPKIGEKWWCQMANLYGNNLLQDQPVQSDYIKEYVPETDEPQRHEIYQIAKEHYDKAIYLLQEATGIFITPEMAEALAENYASLRVYNYIDATRYNIPWYLIYSFNGFPLYHMLVRKDTTLYRELKKIGISLKDSRKEGYVYVDQNKGYVLIATNYRYRVDADENRKEWLDFSILRPDDTEKDTLLFEAIGQFFVRVDSYYFSNLIHFEGWKPQQKLLDIAEKYMNP